MADHFDELKYRVRPGAQPQGKPRVYFTCHPGDAALYFDEIVSDLLKRTNCVVWHKEDPGAFFDDDAQMQDLLSQMQLFVIPVTTRLLTSPSSAMDKEYAFAVANHIPILPLMEEVCIDDLFAQRFGEIQYLAPRRNDPTAISFDAKMDNFLNNVLIGDETASEVRRAFRACIFLSYRKKDRRFALELMRRIHADEHLEDVAIWYDEYLVPGEGFNQAIDSALRRSDLFTLMVTPNIVNEPNYVMRIEYPQARRVGKPILPVQVLLTDRKQLEACYTGVPACVNGHNAQELSAALRKALTSSEFRDLPSDSERKLMIGLAYLDGVDVEVDSKRALRLITAAAALGSTDAMRQLAVMYSEGKGAARSEEEALGWLAKLVDAYRKQGNIIAQGRAMLDYADALTGMGRHTEAGGVMKELLEMTKDLPDAGGVISQLQADAYQRLSVTSNCLGLLDDAMLMIGEAMRLRYGSDMDSWDISRETYAHIVEFLILSAQYSTNQGKFQGAYALYEDAGQILEGLYRDGEILAVEYRAQMAYLLLQRAITAVGEYDYARAERELKESLRLYEQLAGELKTAGVRSNVISCWLNLGYIENARYNYKAAGTYFNTALRLSKQLYTEIPSIQLQNDISLIYQNLANNEMEIGNYLQARVLIQQCRAYLAQLYQSVDSKFCIINYAKCYLMLGRISATEGKPNNALTELNAAEQVISKLCLRLPGERESSLVLASVYLQRGDIRTNQSRFAEARGCYEKALGIIDAIKQTNELFNVIDIKSTLLEQLGCLANLEDKMNQALEYFKQALELREKAKSEGLTHAIQHGLWTLRQNLGEIMLKMRRNDEAYAFFSDALKLAEQFVSISEGIDGKIAQAQLHERLGMVEQLRGNPESAKRHLLTARDLYAQSATKTHSFAHELSLCMIYLRIGTLYCDLGSQTEAIAAFKTMREMGTSLHRRFVNSNLALQAVAQADMQLSNIYSDRGNTELALDLADEALRLYKSSTQKDWATDDKMLMAATILSVITSLLSLGKIERAQMYIRDYEDIATQLYRTGSSFAAKSCLHRIYTIKAGIAAFRGAPNEALELTQKGISLMQQVYQRFPNSDLKFEMIVAYGTCADLEYALGHEDKKETYRLKAARLAETVNRKELSAFQLASLATALKEAAIVMDEREQTQEAKKYFSLALQIAEPLTDTEDTRIEAGIAAVAGELGLGYIAINEGRLREAERRLKHGYELSLRVAKLSMDEETRETLEHYQRGLREGLAAIRQG